MYLLKEVCYFTTPIAAIHFLYGTAIISREHLKQSNVKDPVFISQHLLEPSIVTSGLCFIQKNLKGIFISHFTTVIY